MTTIRLEGGVEKVAAEKPFETLEHTPLYHQVRTLEALRQPDTALVMNTYNTGTGKTIASLLYLFDLDAENNKKYTRPADHKNVLFIAPTNALLAQHVADIEEFVDRNGLNFKVLEVNAAELRALDTDVDRSGERLKRLIRNYLEFDPDSQAVRRKPIILVVNPDIFYYALFFRYGAHDQRNLFEQFLTAFDYLVIDEFHYYDAKQFANFLFAFAIFERFGMFAAGRKVCLLSATPTMQVKTYLDRLFTEDGWQLIAPKNESDESEQLDTIPTLTPLELTIVHEELQPWASQHQAEVQRWLVEENLDGAIISNSLARINEVYALLRPYLRDDIGRITGPEPAAERAQATAKKLILATPTVDIGYNFDKLDKPRQNIDFVICEARHSDDLLQRIGRAGRILGKPVQNHSSRATVLLTSEEAARTLAQYDGQTLPRHDFAQIVNDSELPPKHTLDSYIRSYAITECFWPIWNARRMFPQGIDAELDRLFELVREIFAPNSKRKQKGLSGFFSNWDDARKWLKEHKEPPAQVDKRTEGYLEKWLNWLNPPNPQAWISEEFREHHLASLHAVIQSQVAVIESLFSFRDSFQGPTAVIYDPRRMFSSQPINSYDLFHFLRNYETSPPLTRAQFEQQSGPIPERIKGDFYLLLKKQREQKRSVDLLYRTADHRSRFEQKWCGAPVAMTGVELQLREVRGDAIAGGLSAEMQAALKQTPIVMLIIPPDAQGVVISRTRDTTFWSYRLTVDFPDGSSDDSYSAYLGTAALHLHAELQGYFRMRDRLKADAIFL